MGFLVLLERLTPIERAVFVLHDVLDLPYDAVADAVGRSEDACRQALHRARRHVTVPGPRTPAERAAQAEEVATRFLAVGLGGDLDALLASLAPDIAVISDGGGVVHAAMRTGHGQPPAAARFLHNLAGRFGDDPLFVPCELNGEPGRADARRRTAGSADVVTRRGRAGRGDPRRRQPGQARAPRRHAGADGTVVPGRGRRPAVSATAMANR